jgi:RND family efflux transporter MFP subunit
MRMTTFLALATVTTAACGTPQADADPAPAAPPTATQVVAAESLPATITVEGTVRARHRAEISTRMMARVTAVPVELGTRVREGQTLIRLGGDDIAANRASAEAALTVARAARDEAARQAARMDTLLAQDAVSRVQRDQARLGLTQAEAQLAMAEAARHSVETASGYSQIVAPFDGVIVDRTVDPGDLAAPGAPLLAIESAGGREVALTVSPDVAERLTPGGRLAVITRDGRSAEGVIRAVAGGADPSLRTVEVRVSVPATWPTGVSVTAEVPVGVRSGIAIPESAVVRRGQLTGVRVVKGDMVTLRWIRLGRTIGERIEVLSGLEAGETIAL